MKKIKIDVLSIGKSWLQITGAILASLNRKGHMAELIVKCLEECGVSSRLSFQLCLLEHQPRMGLPRAAATVVLLKQGNLAATIPTVSSMPTPSQVKFMVTI